MQLAFPVRLLQLKCNSLAAPAVETLDALFDTARQHRIGVVVYRSPLNQDFLDRVDADPGQSALDRCERIVLEYLDSLPLSHRNVFVRDLMRYGPVARLRQDGFYDGGHLKPNASGLVIDALLPEIQAAQAWAEAQPPAPP
jgi:hypothetical protein